VSYFLSFIADPDDARAVDGDEVCTTWGMLALMDYCATLDAEEYPELSPWQDETWSDDPAALEAEVARAIKEKPGEPSANVLGILRALLAGLKARPDDAAAVVLTDGTDGGGEDE
jgi:hypothetical protein